MKIRIPWTSGCRSVPAPPSPFVSTFSAAGILFTNGTHVLAGYQPTKQTPTISGIGGLREGEEHYLTTAFREVVEELFGLAYVTEELLAKLERKVLPKTVLVNDNYVIVVMTFDDLERILRIVKKAGIQQYLYAKFPETVADLVFQRKVSVTAEIQSFAVLPLLNYSELSEVLNSEFQNDIQMVAEFLKNTGNPPKQVGE